MKKPTPPVPGEFQPGKFPDDDWEKRFPDLCRFLSDPFYDDGTPRKLAAVTIREQDGRVLVGLTDHDLERGLYRTGTNVRAALESIEKALSNGSADWRPWKQQKGGKGK